MRPMSNVYYTCKVDGSVWSVIPDSYSSGKCWCANCDRLTRCDLWQMKGCERKADLCRQCFAEIMEVRT